MHFTNKGHSLTRYFLWQGPFYAQGALGNAQHLNPLVFQKTFRCPTFITVTVTDNICRSFHFPKQFLEFASVLFDCSTVQCLDITFISDGTFLPFNDRTWKICVIRGLWDFLKGSLKKNIIGFYHWEIWLFCKISRNRLLAEEKKNEDNSYKKLWIWPNVENFMESARVRYLCQLIWVWKFTT